VEEGTCDFETLEKYLLSKEKSAREPTLHSAKQEKFEMLFNGYI
jgi:hypothetical protein